MQAVVLNMVEFYPLHPSMRYRRVLLKLSGEALAGDGKTGISPKVLLDIATEVKEVVELGVQMALVIGGGNIFRGVSAATEGMDRATADYMGMMATVINAMAMQDALERLDVPTRVQSAIEMRALAEPYLRRRALRHLEKGRVVIFAAGTGNPYFTTDTGASLRGMEIHADIIMKATKVDGIYDRDPVKHTDAVLFDHLTFERVLNGGLKVMDATAISLCMENRMPILVFNLHKRGNIMRALRGEPVGTVVGDLPPPPDHSAPGQDGKAQHV